MKDKKEYTKEYNEKNKDYIYEVLTCEICKNTYKRNNKANHQKTKDHQIALLKNKVENNRIFYKEKLGNIFDALVMRPGNLVVIK